MATRPDTRSLSLPSLLTVLFLALSHAPLTMWKVAGLFGGMLAAWILASVLLGLCLVVEFGALWVG